MLVGGAIFAGGYYWQLRPGEILRGADLRGRHRARRNGARAPGVPGERRPSSQVGIELVDAVTRLASNFISFARLACVRAHARRASVRSCSPPPQPFGGECSGGSPRWRSSPSATPSRSRSKARVTGVQALRLEYYEALLPDLLGRGARIRPMEFARAYPSRRSDDRNDPVGLSGLAVVFVATTRRSQAPGGGFRRLLVVNAVIMLAAVAAGEPPALRGRRLCAGRDEYQSSRTPGRALLRRRHCRRGLYDRAGFAVAYTGAAALAAVSEKPRDVGPFARLRRPLQGIAIYGLVVAIVLIGKA